MSASTNTNTVYNYNFFFTLPNDHKYTTFWCFLTYPNMSNTDAWSDSSGFAKARKVLFGVNLRTLFDTL